MQYIVTQYLSIVGNRSQYWICSPKFTYSYNKLPHILTVPKTIILLKKRTSMSRIIPQYCNCKTGAQRFGLTVIDFEGPCFQTTLLMPERELCIEGKKQRLPSEIIHFPNLCRQSTKSSSYYFKREMNILVCYLVLSQFSLGAQRSPQTSYFTNIKY